MIRILDLQRVSNGHRILDLQNASAEQVIDPPWDTDFDAWLESDDAIPNLLVVAWPLIDGVPTRVNLSTLGYTTPGTNSPVFYEPAITTGIPIAGSLSLTGGASISAGDLEIDNTDGVRETWKGYDWMNTPIEQFVGDLRWLPADYRKVYVGVSGGLVPKDDHTLALIQLSMTQRLDAAMTEQKLGGTGPNQDALVHLAFGECHNVPGQLTDLMTRTFHDSPIEAVKRVRANALPVDFTEDVSAASCELEINNQGAAITASIQGDKAGGVYRNTIGALVRRIVTGYGKAGARYTEADIDAENFAAFEAANPQPVGLYISERMNVLVACDTLANSVRAQLSPTREGKLRLIKIEIPDGVPTTEIRPHHILPGTLRPVQHFDPIAAATIGFCRNWTVQMGLVSPISDQARELFETEWLTDSDVVPGGRQAALNLDGAPAQRNTMLLRRVDAHAEVQSDLALWGPGRGEFELTALAPMLKLQPGDQITIYNDLYGMEQGKRGQVLYAAPHYQDRQTVVRILV